MFRTQENYMKNSCLITAMFYRVESRTSFPTSLCSSVMVRMAVPRSRQCRLRRQRNLLLRRLQHLQHPRHQLPNGRFREGRAGSYETVLLSHPNPIRIAELQSDGAWLLSMRAACRRKFPHRPRRQTRVRPMTGRCWHRN